jgi:uncharacterized damage-inducible protein DinB
MTTKDLLLRQTHLAFERNPEMSLKTSIQVVTAQVAAKRLVPQSWTIEEIVYHIASVKIEYCKQGFGKWTADYEKPVGDFRAMVALLDRAQNHLVCCLQICSDQPLMEPIATQCHGESAAHFFSIMMIHDVSHAGQIRTRQRAFGTPSRVTSE